MINISALAAAAAHYDAGDPRRVQHFIKVYGYCRLLRLSERLDAHTQNMLEAAALLHDIGIHEAERQPRLVCRSVSGAGRTCGRPSAALCGRRRRKRDRTHLLADRPSSQLSGRREHRFPHSARSGLLSSTRTRTVCRAKALPLRASVCSGRTAAKSCSMIFFSQSHTLYKNKTERARTQCSRSLRISLELSLVGASPQTHLLCVLDQLLAEIRVRNRNQRFRTLPCSQTLEVDLAVLGYEPVCARTGVGDNRTCLKRRTNAAFERAVLLLEGGRAADEALAALWTGMRRARSRADRLHRRSA